MKVNGQGQARILSPSEINSLFEEFSLRDRTVFAFWRKAREAVI